MGRRSTSLRRRRLGLVLALAVAAVGVTPAATHAAPGWLSPIDVAAGQHAHPAHPQLAVDDEGNTVAVWRRNGSSGFVIQAATRPAGGTWSPPQTLSGGIFDATNPQVAVDGGGNAVAVWQENGIQAATRPAGGRWGSPRTLSTTTGRVASDPQVAIDAHGEAVVVWHSGDPSNSTKVCEGHGSCVEACEGTGLCVIEASTRRAGGDWSAPRTLSSTSGESSYDAEVAADAEGNAVAVWRKNDELSSDFVIQAASRSGGDWSPPQTLSSASTVAIGGTRPPSPQVSMNSQGDAVVVWSGHDGRGYIVQAAARPAGGSWVLPATAISTTGGDALGPKVALDAQGNATVVWYGFVSDVLGLVPQAATRPAGGSWTLPEKISASAGYEPQLALDPKGNAVAIWQRPPYVVQAATRPAEGPWSAAHDLTSPGRSDFSPQVAVDPRGNAVALWNSAGSSSTAVFAAGYDAAGPQLRNLVVPASGVTGSLLSFSVSPLDVWSPVEWTSWELGDGTRKNEAAISHSYAAPGTYQVKVTSMDKVGNSSTETRTVTIASPTTGGGDTGTLPGGTVGTGTTGTGTTTLPGTGTLQTGTLSGTGATTSAMRAALRRCITRANGLSTRARRRAARIRCERAGRPGGPRASAASRSEIILSFRAPGSVGRGGPPARRYVIKQSTRPIRSERDFGRALTLCGRACAFAPRRRGERLSLRITELRSKRTYYYAIKAVGAGRRTGPRSETVRARTR